MANESQQAAAIPFRVDQGKLRVCLTRKLSNGKWGIPKGFVDPGDTRRDTVLKETLEEAGLRGKILGKAVGSYLYTKWGNSYSVRVYLLEVTAQEISWEEKNIRERRWMSPERARKRCRDRPFATVFELAMRELSRMER